MTYEEASASIFAYATVAVETPVQVANGDVAFVPSGESQVVGLAFDWRTNRVYRVMEVLHHLEDMAPVRNVSQAMSHLLESQVHSDLRFVSADANADYEGGL